MKNFIFKSSSNNIDLHKIYDLVKILATEQRLQRSDLAKIIRLVAPPREKQETLEEFDGLSNTEFGE